MCFYCQFLLTFEPHKYKLKLEVDDYLKRILVELLAKKSNYAEDRRKLLNAIEQLVEYFKDTDSLLNDFELVIDSKSLQRLKIQKKRENNNV